MVPDPDVLAESLAELVRIPSVNPLHAGPKSEAAGPIGERALAEHIAARLDALGATDVELDVAVDDRPNVYGRIPGRTERLVVVDTHLDTVTVEHMTDPPFDGRIEGGAVWGRGALDTKATAGVLLALFESWQSSGLVPEPSVLFVGTVGEEGGGMPGAFRFVDWVRERSLEIDQLIAAEPTRLCPIHGHKGGLGVRITAVGTAAHSAVPHLGANAIEAMAPVISALEAEHHRLIEGPAANELGTATLSVTKIEGGTAANVIPGQCTITVVRRNVPGDDPDAEYDRLLRIATDACALPVEIELMSHRPDGRKGGTGFYSSPDSDVARILARAASTEPTVAPFGTNAGQYDGLAREIVVFGPGAIDEAHQATERVAIDDLVKLAEAYTQWLDPAQSATVVEHVRRCPGFD